MAQRGTFARRATHVGGSPLLGPILLGPAFLGPAFPGSASLGVVLTRRPYVDFGYLASAACRG